MPNIIGERKFVAFGRLLFLACALLVLSGVIEAGAAGPPLPNVSNPGSATPQEDDTVKRLRRAAEQGDATAQCGLAFRLGDGRGVPKDVPESVKLLRTAAYHGSPWHNWRWAASTADMHATVSTRSRM